MNFHFFRPLIAAIMDLTATGISAETGLLTSWPDKGPPMLWEKSIGEGYSGPVVAGNRLILFHRVENEDVVECLDAVTGKGQWKFVYATEYRDNFGKGDGPRATPLIAAGRVFTLGPQGELHCLDLSTGKKVWVHFLAKEYELPDNFFGIGTSPILENDLLLVNGSFRQRARFQRGDGQRSAAGQVQQASYSSPVATAMAR